MRWTPDIAYLKGLDLFTGVVDQVPASDWERQSPCAGWRALDVLGHMGVAVRFGNRLLAGEGTSWEPVDPPGGAVEGEPARWWREVTQASRRLVEQADLDREVDSPFRRRSIADGLRFPALDLFVHAWDVARSVGLPVAVPSEAVDFAHRVLDPMPEEQLRSPRVFGPAVAVPTGAGGTEAFLALTGRDPQWRPPT